MKPSIQRRQRGGTVRFKNLAAANTSPILIRASTVVEFSASLALLCPENGDSSVEDDSHVNCSPRSSGQGLGIETLFDGLRTPTATRFISTAESPENSRIHRDPAAAESAAVSPVSSKASSGPETIGTKPSRTGVNDGGATVGGGSRHARGLSSTLPGCSRHLSTSSLDGNNSVRDSDDDDVPSTAHRACKACGELNSAVRPVAGTACASGTPTATAVPYRRYQRRVQAVTVGGKLQGWRRSMEDRLVHFSAPRVRAVATLATRDDRVHGARTPQSGDVSVRGEEQSRPEPHSSSPPSSETIGVLLLDGHRGSVAADVVQRVLLAELAAALTASAAAAAPSPPPPPEEEDEQSWSEAMKDGNSHEVPVTPRTYEAIVEAFVATDAQVLETQAGGAESVAAAIHDLKGAAAAEATALPTAVATGASGAPPGVSRSASPRSPADVTVAAVASTDLTTTAHPRLPPLPLATLSAPGQGGAGTSAPSAYSYSGSARAHRVSSAPSPRSLPSSASNITPRTGGTAATLNATLAASASERPPAPQRRLSISRGFHIPEDGGDEEGVNDGSSSVCAAYGGITGGAMSPASSMSTGAAMRHALVSSSLNGGARGIHTPIFRDDDDEGHDDDDDDDVVSGGAMTTSTTTTGGGGGGRPIDMDDAEEGSEVETDVVRLRNLAYGARGSGSLGAARDTGKDSSGGGSAVAEPTAYYTSHRGSSVPTALPAAINTYSSHRSGVIQGEEGTVNDPRAADRSRTGEHHSNGNGTVKPSSVTATTATTVAADSIPSHSLSSKTHSLECDGDASPDADGEVGYRPMPSPIFAGSYAQQQQPSPLSSHGIVEAHSLLAAPSSSFLARDDNRSQCTYVESTIRRSLTSAGGGGGVGGPISPSASRSSGGGTPCTEVLTDLLPSCRLTDSSGTTVLLLLVGIAHEPPHQRQHQQPFGLEPTVAATTGVSPSPPPPAVVTVVNLGDCQAFLVERRLPSTKGETANAKQHDEDNRDAEWMSPRDGQDASTATSPVSRNATTTAGEVDSEKGDRNAATSTAVTAKQAYLGYPPMHCSSKSPVLPAGLRITKLSRDHRPIVNDAEYRRLTARFGDTAFLSTPRPTQAQQLPSAKSASSSSVSTFALPSGKAAGCPAADPEDMDGKRTTALATLTDADKACLAMRRVGGRLAVSRALGDFDLKLSRIPRELLLDEGDATDSGLDVACSVGGGVGGDLDAYYEQKSPSAMVSVTPTALSLLRTAAGLPRTVSNNSSPPLAIPNAMAMAPRAFPQRCGSAADSMSNADVVDPATSAEPCSSLLLLSNVPEVRQFLVPSRRAGIHRSGAGAAGGWPPAAALSTTLSCPRVSEENAAAADMHSSSASSLHTGGCCFSEAGLAGYQPLEIVELRPYSLLIAGSDGVWELQSAAHIAERAEKLLQPILWEMYLKEEKGVIDESDVEEDVTRVLTDSSPMRRRGPATARTSGGGHDNSRRWTRLLNAALRQVVQETLQAGVSKTQPPPSGGVGGDNMTLSITLLLH